MLTKTLQDIFVRDLNKLKKEIELYSNETDLWKIEKEIANSAGNLCLHLVGNLNTYIGTVMGNTGYVRNRDLEFSQKNIARAELILKIENTIAMIEKVLPTISNEKLLEEYPVLVMAEKTSTEFFLVHLATHLTYHLGQVNYHRRLVAAK